jgi:hypothetical protein
LLAVLWNRAIEERLKRRMCARVSIGGAQESMRGVMP